MPYRRSAPLRRWLHERSRTIDILAQGHAHVGQVAGPGRPLDVSKPLAHAYLIVMLREFQAFVRDLHDLSTEHLVTASTALPTYRPLLIEGLTRGRSLDRGNATPTAIKEDFRRLGLTTIDIGAHNDRWAGAGGDSRSFELLLRLRNALGHGNETELRSLVASGQVSDSITWARGRRPVLNRYARALDHIVWEHLQRTTGSEPWR